MPTIRRAEAGDAAALAQLMTQLGYATSAAEMTARMQSISANPNFATFVANEDDDLCGMIGLSIAPSFEHNDRTGYIVALVASEKVRRRGVGRQLMEAAHRFYEALGFVRTGFRFAKNLER